MGTSIIQIENLCKRYKNVNAVDNVSFNVEKGEIFALLGPNGAGKSTTIKMLTTLLKPTSGHLILNGYDVVKEQASVRKSFGIVFQDPSLDADLSAYENMEIHAVMYGVPKAHTANRIQTLMELVELWDRKDDLVRTFSGGMKRRLEIARGLLHKPVVLFLDEPTLGLDAQTRNKLWNYVAQLNSSEHMTVFFTTHYLEEAELNADRIAFVDQGKLIVIGTVDELKERTKTTTLEQAYLALTGLDVRDKKADAHDAWRERHRARAMR